MKKLRKQFKKANLREALSLVQALTSRMGTIWINSLQSRSKYALSSNQLHYESSNTEYGRPTQEIHLINSSSD